MTTNVGSYLLRDLKDPALPEAISWLPQTIGWKIIALIALLFITYAIYKKYRHYWQNRYRNEAKNALRGVNTDDPIMAINQYQQIINIVMNYLHLVMPAQVSKSNNLIEMMMNTSTAPINETLLSDWYNTLIQPNKNADWSQKKLRLLRCEIEAWLTTHHVEKVSV